MPTANSIWIDIAGLLAILLLVAANGFFVAAEFSLVAVRRSRVTQLVAEGQRRARALKRTIDHLDANLAATQLGITISSLALGWIGEPALAHLIQPFLTNGLVSLAQVGSHAISVTIAFVVITALHIVLGELAPKSLALQRSERTALAVVRPLALFRVLFWPAIVSLNGLGNLLLRFFGLRPGATEETLHSPEELKLLIAASQEAGLLQQTQQELFERILGIGKRPIADVMTPRVDVEWIDANDDIAELRRRIRQCGHAQLLVGKGTIDEPIGMVLKKDLLDQILDGQAIDPLAAMRQPIALHETMPIFRVLEEFKSAPVRLATILDEYGVLQGIVTRPTCSKPSQANCPRLKAKSQGWSSARMDRC